MNPTEMASLTVNALAPSTVRTLVVTVSGPGMDSAVVTNIPVAENAVAQGTLVVPAGATRRLIVVAVDTGNVWTHRADTTLRLEPGPNGPIALTLRPLSSSLGVTVTFGAVTMTLTTSDTLMYAGDSLQLSAAASTPWSSVPADSIRWATDAPAFLTVSNGLVRATRPGSGTVSVTFGDAVVRRRIMVLTRPSTAPIYFKYVPDGGSYGAEEIYRVNPDGSGFSAVVARVGMDRMPELSTDRSRLAISSEAWCTPACSGQIVPELYVGNADGSSMTRVTTGASPVYGKSFSPDGTKLVFESQMGTVNAIDRRLWIVNADGTGLTQLTTEESQFPDWSPDGSKILYCARAGIVTVSPTGTGRQVLRSFSTATNPPMDCNRATWSPSGDRIAFDAPGNDIWVMNSDGSNAVQLTTGASVDVAPVWSPDGAWIAFSSNRSGRLQVWVISATGSDLRQVTTQTTGGANEVVWR